MEQEIPQKFVEKHGSNLSKYAFLEVSSGKIWKVELKRCDSRIWLRKGWQEFVDNCSIKCGYSLVFSYEDRSLFHVFIFDTRVFEIEYPVSSVCLNQRVNCDQPKVMEIKEEDIDEDNSIEILNKRPQKTRGVSVANYSSKGVSASSARDGVLQRARAFQSQNPHFIVIMRPTYLHLYIPQSPVKRYFHGRDGNSIHVYGPDGRSWLMTYHIGGPPLCQLRIGSGWNKFAQEYQIRGGDACIFELINAKVIAFNIFVFRITEQEDEEEVNKNELKSLQHSNRSFTIVIKLKTPTLYTLRIPHAHASRYLLDQHQKEVFLHLHGLDGKTWPVKCCVYVLRVRLSAGWREFVVDSDLQEGDGSVYVLLSQVPNHYNVTILHAVESAKPNYLESVSKINASV